MSRIVSIIKNLKTVCGIRSILRRKKIVPKNKINNYIQSIKNTGRLKLFEKILKEKNVNRKPTC